MALISLRRVRQVRKCLVSPKYIRSSYVYLKLWDYEQSKGIQVTADDQTMALVEQWTGLRKSNRSQRYTFVRDYLSWKKEYNKW